jgi:hypothetical protein
LWELCPAEIGRFCEAVGDEYERRAIHDAFLAAYAFNAPKELSKLHHQREAARLKARGGRVDSGAVFLEALKQMGVTRPMTEEEKKQ